MQQTTKGIEKPMRNQSVIVRAMTRDGSARIVCADSSAIVQKAHTIHQTSKTMTSALGRCLTVTSLMGSLLKDKTDALTVQIKGDGPAGTVLCTSDYKGNVRGYAENPQVELPPNSAGKLNVGGAIGQGTLYVIRDFGTGEPYVGISNLVSGEIGEDISQYYVTSEQTPTVCALGVRANLDHSCKSAGGFLLQLLPGADPALIPQLEQNVTTLGSVSKLIELGKTPEEIIAMVFDGIPYDIFDEIDIDYLCNCNREKYKRALLGLSRDDLDSLIQEGTPVETECRFCRTKYVFPVDELIACQSEAAEGREE